MPAGFARPVPLIVRTRQRTSPFASTWFVVLTVNAFSMSAAAFVPLPNVILVPTLAEPLASAFLLMNSSSQLFVATPVRSVSGVHERLLTSQANGATQTGHVSVLPAVASPGTRVFAK